MQQRPAECPEKSPASLKNSDIIDSSVAENETENSLSRATGETMSEHSDDNPQGGLKSHKKWGGVLFNLLISLKYLGYPPKSPL